MDDSGAKAELVKQRTARYGSAEEERKESTRRAPSFVGGVGAILLCI